jgi:hypothetical protein
MALINSKKTIAVLRWEPGVRVAVFFLLAGLPTWWLIWGAGLVCRSLRYSFRAAEQIWLSLAIAFLAWFSYYYWFEMSKPHVSGACAILVAYLLADAFEGSDQFFFRRAASKRYQ